MRTIELMLGFDAASVAAMTRFLALSEQPMESVRELESIDVPVIVFVEQVAPDMIERLPRF